MIAKLRLGIDWKLTTPQAPWQGEIYEKLIGIFKNCLRKAAGKALLFDFEFENVMIRIEGIMNACPIVQLSDDSVDILRPIDFLSSKITMSSENFEPEHVASRKTKATVTHAI